MTNKVILICILVCSAFFGCKESTAQEHTKLVSPNEMQKLIESEEVQLIDVRTPKEFQEGHLKNAKNIDFLLTTFSSDINTLDNQKPVFIYCHSGNRSGKSVKQFLEAGFTKIYDLDGGIVKWKAQGLPIESNR